MLREQSSNARWKTEQEFFCIADKNYRNIDGIATKVQGLAPGLRSLDFRSSSRYVVQVIAPSIQGVSGAVQFKVANVLTSGAAAQ
jgi:hypothetical protein